MMGYKAFRFKRFAVDQECCTMKVGTDGVLLGAWCRIEPHDKAILDIGTGSGVIALMLAQRTENHSAGDAGIGTIIEAAEIDEASARQAQRNFSASEWAGRLIIHAMSIQEFARTSPARFDCIVSNPPFFVDSLTSPSSSRTIARHTGSLPFDELIAASDKLLSPHGRLSMILPPSESERMIEAATKAGMIVSRRTEVHSTPKSGPRRILLEFSRLGAPDTSQYIPTATLFGDAAPVLTIQDAGPGTFSSDYRTLTRDFYLNF